MNLFLTLNLEEKKAVQVKSLHWRNVSGSRKWQWIAIYLIEKCRYLQLYNSYLVSDKRELHVSIKNDYTSALH